MMLAAKVKQNKRDVYSIPKNDIMFHGSKREMTSRTLSQSENIRKDYYEKRFN